MAETVIVNCGLFQVCMANVISVLRCIISMLLSSDQDDIVDRVSCVTLYWTCVPTVCCAAWFY